MSVPRTLIQQSIQHLYAIMGTEHPLLHTNRAVADHAVAGEINFHVHGNRLLFVGRHDIDWNAPQFNHQEWPAQLNRFFFLPSLAAAFAETGEAQYAEAARDYLAEWMRAHPVRLEWTIAQYDNTLNLCIRMQQWTVSLLRLLDSSVFDDAFVEEMLASIACQLDFLSTHLTPAANWRIAQVDALLTCGIILTHLPSAANWRRLAVRVLNDAFFRQVLPDGAHMERNPGYHHWMTDVFTRFWRLGKAMPELGLAMQAEPIARMHDYNVATLLPNGALNRLHDSDGRRSGPAEDRYLKARSAFRREAGLPDTPPPTEQIFPVAGQACLRDSWDEDAVYVTFDATTWGGAHCHLSRNAVQVHAFGRSLLVDPGTLTYEVSDPLMAHGKSTRAHNTLNLNGWNQSVADPAWMKTASLPGYDLVQSLYQGGYWPGRYTWWFEQGRGAGIFGEHYRALLWLRGRCIIVLDQLTRDHDTPGMETPTLESNWQLCDGPVAIDAAHGRAVTGYDDANLLLLFPLQLPGMQLTAHAGERDPMRGWLPDGNEFCPATQLCLAGTLTHTINADLATVLVPFRGADAPAVTADATAPISGVQTLTLRWGDGTADELIYTPRLAAAISTHADLETDAALVHMRKDATGNVVSGLVVDGTYLSPYVKETKAAPETFTFSKE